MTGVGRFAASSRLLTVHLHSAPGPVQHEDRSLCVNPDAERIYNRLFRKPFLNGLLLTQDLEGSVALKLGTKAAIRVRDLVDTISGVGSTGTRTPGPVFPSSFKSRPLSISVFRTHIEHRRTCFPKRFSISFNRRVEKVGYRRPYVRLSPGTLFLNLF